MAVSTSGKASLTGLAPELLSAILACLSQAALGSLSRTCKSMHNIVMPHLFSTVYISDYRSLQSLLSALEADSTRSSLLQTIRLTGDETSADEGEGTPSTLTRVFQHSFENLKSLTVDGHYMDANEQDKKHLVDSILKQPSIKQLKFRTESDNGDTYYWGREELRLVTSPVLQQLTLCNFFIDVSRVQGPSPSSEAERRPFDLLMWECDYSMDGLKQLVTLLRPLRSFSMYHPDFLYNPMEEEKSASPSDYVNALEPAASTLIELTLDYDKLWSEESQRPLMSLQKFTALKFLRISPDFLRASDEEIHLSEDLSSRMPPNLEMLVLDPVFLNSAEDVATVESLLKAKRALAPHLSKLSIYKAFDQDIPANFPELAHEADVHLLVGEILTTPDDPWFSN